MSGLWPNVQDLASGFIWFLFSHDHSGQLWPCHALSASVLTPTGKGNIKKTVMQVINITITAWMCKDMCKDIVDQHFITCKNEYKMETNQELTDINKSPNTYQITGNVTMGWSTCLVFRAGIPAIWGRWQTRCHRKSRKGELRTSDDTKVMASFPLDQNHEEVREKYW